MPIAIAATGSYPPNPATLVSPADAATESVQGGLSASWDYNPTTTGNTQTGWYFERQVLGVGVWQWWDDTNQAWSDGAVLNSGSATSVTFPAGSWVDGETYAWSVSTVDAGGQSKYAEPFTIVASGVASVAITYPVGGIDYSDPTVTWTSSFALGFSQAAFELVIESGTTSGATAPGTGTTVYDSGLVASTAQSATLPYPLPPAETLTAFLQLSGSDGLLTPWAYAAFTTPSGPSAPTLSATASTWASTGSAYVALSAAWDVSGSLPSDYQTTVTFYYSDDGTDWYEVRGGQVSYLNTSSGTATADDHECTPGVSRSYKAVLAYYPNHDSPPENATTAVSNVVSATTTTGKWWLKHLTDPDATVGFSLAPGELSTIRTEREQVVQPIGRTDPVVLSDKLVLPTITLNIVFLTDANYQAFLKLRETQEVFLLEGPYPQGAWYVRLGDTTADSTNLSSLRFSTQTVRTVTIDCQAVASAGEGYTLGSTTG